MAKITLYTQTYCQTCDDVRRYMKNKNIDFEEINILKPENKQHFDIITEKEFEFVPVTSINDFEVSWEGFQHHRLIPYMKTEEEGDE